MKLKGILPDSWVWIFVTLNVVAAVMQNLSMPLWLNNLGRCGNPFVVYQISCTMFVLMFAITVLILTVVNGNKFFTFCMGLTKRGVILIILAGIFDALNGIFVVIASPINRTPPIISAVFPNISLIVMIFLIWLLHKRRYLPEPTIKRKDFASLEFILFGCTYALCVYSTVVAANEKEAELDGQAWWWVIFLFGTFFGYVYNQFQEIFFKTEKGYRLETNTVTNYLLLQITVQWLTGLLLTGIIFIPGVSFDSSTTIACDYLQTLKYSFRGYGLLYNLIFNFGYYIAYIASVATNTVNTGLTMLLGPVATAIIMIISYNIPVLTPDKSIINVWFFFPMIMSALLMTFFYSYWYKGTRLGRVTALRAYLSKFDVPEDELFNEDDSDEASSLLSIHSLNPDFE